MKLSPDVGGYRAWHIVALVVIGLTSFVTAMVVQALVQFTTTFFALFAALMLFLAMLEESR